MCSVLEVGSCVPIVYTEMIIILSLQYISHLQQGLRTPHILSVQGYGHAREEEQLFDMASFREAWINACLLTRWETKNPPAVYIFSDRLEIVSTGGLPVDLTKGEFYRGISKPVNQKLQKIFGQLGYVEQTGHGVPLIVSNYGMQAFEITTNFITVVIPFRRGVEPLSNEKTISAGKYFLCPIWFFSKYVTTWHFQSTAGGQSPPSARFHIM